MSDIIVQFTPKGHKELIAAINKLKVAQGNASKGSKNFTDQTGRLRSSMGGLQNSFATVRSKLLLVNFAMAMGVKQLTQFGQQAAKVESLSTAFTTLSGGVDSSTIALDKLKRATNNTMSEMELLKQANNAMILGVSKNSDEMADLFDMAQRLGRALGRDATSSVESLVTGIGRQSRMMLDNIGIIVKAEDAYKSYARQIGKTENTLTDAERKQAFLNATLDSARQKLKALGDETLGSQDAYDQFTAAMTDLSSEVGKLVNDALLPAVKGMTDFMNALDDKKLQNAAQAVTSIAAGFLALKSHGKVAAAGLAIFNTAINGTMMFLVGSWTLTSGAAASGGIVAGLKMLGTGFLRLLGPAGIFATVVGGVTFGLLKLFNVFGDSNEESKKLDKNINNVNDAMKNVNSEPINQELQGFIDKMKESNEFLQLVGKSMKTDLMASFASLTDSVTPLDTLNKNIKDQKVKVDAAKVAWKDYAQKIIDAGSAGDNSFKKAERLEKEYNELNDTLLKLESRKETNFFNVKETDVANLEIFKSKFEEITGLSSQIFQEGEADALQKSIGTTIQSEEELLAVLNIMSDKKFALNEEAIEAIAINARNNDEGEKTITIQDKLTEAFNNLQVAKIEQLDTDIKLAEIAESKGELDGRQITALRAMQAEYDKLTDTEAKNAEFAEKNRQKRMKSVSSIAMIADSYAGLGQVVGATEKQVMGVQAIAAVANAYKAASDTWADETIKPTWLRFAAAASHYVAAYANVRGIYNQMGKIDGAGGGSSGGGVSGAGGPVGTFAEGGYVGGRPHSQGGTMIEAERGEFVMSKNAVDSIGLEALNQMNQQGGGGSINVSVTGNVLTQDFVEGELAESIKEAVRKGSDFGIS